MSFDSGGEETRLALQPMLQTSSRHLWQIYMLETEGEAGAKPAPGT